jgi:ABC-type transport system involved in multi-copper enzyme maturation permease subunit
MLWKERHLTRLKGPTRIAAAVVALVLLAIVGYALYELAAPAFREMLSQGLAPGDDHSARSNFNIFTRVFTGGLFCLVGLGVANAAAVSISSEKDEDTWISLISTPLTPDEILRAKFYGAVWSVRWFIGLLLFVWLTATLCGAIHPFGLMALVAQAALFLWFAAVLGLLFSIRCRNSLRALTWTILTLLILNGGYLFVVLMIYDDSPMVAFACTPFTLAVSAASYEDVWGLLRFTSSNMASSSDFAEMVMMVILGVVAYLLASIGLTHLAIQRFERMIDRPRLPANQPPAPPTSRVDPALAWIES